ncbi:hypothetical protein LXL04_030154 [Taraxacum kok-saghyz]
MSSRISGRFTRVTGEEGGNHIGANPTESGGVFGVSVIPPVDRVGRGRGHRRSTGRGRGRGRGTTTAPAAAPSGHGSSNSNCIRAQGHGQGRNTNVVTREELTNEIARAIHATLPNVIAQARDALLNVNDDNMGGGEDDYKTFMTCKPPVFDGEPDPIKSTRWITEIEGTFDTSKCADEDRVVYAVTMFKNETIYWWGMVKEVRGRDVAKRMSWDEFTKISKEKFCPRTTVKQLEEEFLKLEQGNMTVRKYTTKFIEKARFAKLYVSTEEMRVERYIWGLQTSIREFVEIQKPGTFQSAVDAAESREREKNREGEDRTSGKRKSEVTSIEFKKGRTSSPERNFEKGFGTKQCSKCNRDHEGECTMNQRTCYKCEKTGHLSPDCKVGKVCFRCGSPYHIRSNCPQNRSNNQGKIADKDNHPADKKAETYKPKVRSYNMTTHEA